MNSSLNDFIDANALPASVNTGWYIPSLKDWQNIEAQYDLLATQLEKAGGKGLQTFTGKHYWSCNLRSAGVQWTYVLHANTLATRYIADRCDYTNYYRYLFAF
jgi:hypothetical protein